MVFRGKPSKACERCRARRLKCDLQPFTCGQCMRATVACSGYRDTQHLRIQDESQAVARKVFQRTSGSHVQSLPLSLESQAQDAFFAYYVTGTSNCWTFLKQYYHPTDSPSHLKLAIEAVSLAYFWHQMYSDVALLEGRKKYGSALRMTNQALQSPVEATKHTTLLASLLLDLFEKITESSAQNRVSWRSHLTGALAIAQSRGLRQFEDPSEVHALVRLNNHYLASAFVSATMVSDDFIAMRAYVRHLNVHDHTLQLSELMIRYAKLRSETKSGALSTAEGFTASVQLDSEIQRLDDDMPLSWQYSSRLLDQHSARSYGDHFDVYPHRNICQARNMLRVMRLLLNKLVLEHHPPTSAGDISTPLSIAAREHIKTLAGEICAAVQQYTDCEGVARSKLDSLQVHDQGRIADHLHTPHHRADCYSLIFPLYAAGRANSLPGVRCWVTKQLRYLGTHFLIRDAELVAQILERGSDICPWEVYAMLGSYAFNA